LKTKTLVFSALIAFAAVGVIGGAIAYGVHELHLSQGFHAQLLQLKKSADAEQAEQIDEMNRRSASRQLELDQLNVRNAQLDVNIAQLEGKGLTEARERLRLSQGQLSDAELSVKLGNDVDSMQSREPSSALVAAGLPSHVSTYRDRRVMDHFKSVEAASIELSACIDKNFKPDNADTPKECQGFEKQVAKDRDYIAAAIDGKY
jgi:hypothetical protein